MRPKIIALFLFVFVLIGCSSATAPIAGHWQQVMQLPNDVHYNKIFFADSHNGWVVGDSGRILRTSDAGENWQVVQIGSTQDFHCLVFVDDQNGWVAGRGSAIFHTTDAGNSWSRQFVATDSLHRFLSMSFVNAQTGWVASNFGEILYTTDAGNSWSFQQSGTQWALNSIHFVNASLGWASTPNQIIVRTTDGGRNWETIDFSSSHSPGWCTDIKFIDEQRGWIATTVAPSSSIQPGSPLFYTEDGGTTWTQQAVLTSLWLTSIAVVYPGFAWVAGDNQIFYTSDGGITWGSQHRDDGQLYVSLSFTDTAHGWALSFGGAVLSYEL